MAEMALNHMTEFRQPSPSEWMRILEGAAGSEELPTLQLQDPDLAFRVLRGEDRERVFLRVLHTLASPLERAGAHRKTRWIQGWQEMLDQFVARNYDLAALQPQFVRRGEVMRLAGDYLQPATQSLEPAMVGVLRRFLFRRYFAEVKAVCEFGAGTGHNLVALAEMYPHKEIHALDWVEPAVRIFELLRQKHGLNIQGHLFDLAAPDRDFRHLAGNGVLTVGALEQLGDRFGPFLDYLLAYPPAICVHVETLSELYDRENLFDWVAAQYLEKRSYLHGFLTALRQAEAQGRLEILKVKRTFGSLYHDGYSYVAWRPRSQQT